MFIESYELAKEKEKFYAEHTNSESERFGLPIKRKRIIPKKFIQNIRKRTVTLKGSQHQKIFKPNCNKLQKKIFNKRFEMIMKNPVDNLNNSSEQTTLSGK